MSFSLDARLSSDTDFVGDLPLCRVLLMNNSRWPWLVLVPRRDNLAELSDLEPVDRTRLTEEAAQTADWLKTHTRAEKINLGALGNIVRQLHVHVVARSAGDPGWPGPVWGFSAAVPYEDNELRAMMAAARAGLGRQPHHRPRLQARHRQGARSGHRRLQPRRRTGPGRSPRGRALRRARLAPRASGRDRDRPRQAPSEGRDAGALRRLVELCRRPLLPVGQARLQPRRQEGQAADRLWPSLRARWVSGAIEVFEGNTGDPATLADQVAKLKRRFAIDHVVLVGDRGMITQARIDEDSASRRPRLDHGAARPCAARPGRRRIPADVAV